MILRYSGEKGGTTEWTNSLAHGLNFPAALAVGLRDASTSVRFAQDDTGC